MLQEYDLIVLKTGEEIANDGFHVCFSIFVDSIRFSKSQTLGFDFRNNILVLLEIDRIENVVLLLASDGVPNHIVVEDLCLRQRNVDLKTVVIHLDFDILHLVADLHNTAAFYRDGVGGSGHRNIIEEIASISGIFSFGANEDYEEHDEHSRDALERIIADYNKTFSTNFSTETFAAYHKDISDRVKGKKTKSLDILLVVNMFLTGFDSKPLSVLYVDKDMMYHDLLQAYSRTNRVEKETKPWGIIVCYRNLKQKTDDALALFSKGQTEGVLTKDFEFYVQKFNELVTKIKEIAPTPASIDMLYSEDDQKEFVLLFRELTRYLLSLQTFVEFRFDRSNLDLTDQ